MCVWLEIQHSLHSHSRPQPQASSESCGWPTQLPHKQKSNDLCNFSIFHGNLAQQQPYACHLNTYFTLVICGAFKCFVSVRAKWPPQKLVQAPWAEQQKAATENNLRIRVRREVVQENKGVMCDAIWLTVSFCKMGPPNSDGWLPELLPQHSVISSNCFWLQVHLTDHAYIRMACNYHFCPRSDQICIL